MTLDSLIAQERRSSLTETEQKDAKKAASLEALSLVQDGMTLGLGTGSTVRFFLEGLAKRIEAENLRVWGVPTSVGTERMARELKIPLVEGGERLRLANDLCVDGADRVDNDGQLVKGGGGALLREKLVAFHSQRLCIMVDQTKLVPVLDGGFPVPIECVPFGIDSTIERIEALGCAPRLRQTDQSTMTTDNGNVIVDARFEEIADPASLAASLGMLPGVVEVGLFIHLMSTLVVGRPDGSASVWSRT